MSLAPYSQEVLQAGQRPGAGRWRFGGRRILLAATLAVGLPALSGCFPLAVTGAAVGTMAVLDRRTLGAQTEDQSIELKALRELNQAFANGGASVTVTSFNRRVLMAGCFMAIAVGALMAPMMGGGSLLGCWAFLSLALLTMGFVYGPLGAFLPGLFPARVRYTGASMAFNVGGIIGGGLTPMVAQALSTQGGLVPVGIYLAVAALISLVALLPLKHQQA